MTSESVWVPDACTLPTDERPLRVAEFDELFASALRHPHRVHATRLRLDLDPGAAERARDLIARESACCSFFTFTITTAGAELTIDVDVPVGQAGVLDGVVARAAAARRAR